MQDIEIDSIYAEKVPDLALGIIQCGVKVDDSGESLLACIKESLNEIEASLQVEQIAKLPAIQASRKAYKATGKDPARYRLSAESLLRRVVKGKGLYQVNNVVDLLNLVSVKTGFSIGGYDVKHIEGKAILGIGEEGEPYEGIGRGVLNIAGMPLFRDDKGAFGSPTSDSTRTRVREETSEFLMVFFGFGGEEGLQEAMDLGVAFLEKYAVGGDFETRILH